MQPMIRRNLSIGSCAVTIGILLIVIRGWTPQPQNTVLLSSSIISAGLLFIVISIFQQQYVDAKSMILDERILKIRAHTFMKAFSFSFTVVCVLGILNFSGVWVMDAHSAVMIIFFTMGLSASVLSWYYSKQGDICED